MTLLAVLSASACAPGGKNPEPSAPSSSAADTNAAAPKVENPKNLKAITDACQLLTDQQVKDLGGVSERRPPEKSTNSYGESRCQWATDAFTAAASINTKHGGLAKIQQNAENRQNYKLTQLAGYQGARVDEQSDLCRIELAVADDQSLEVNYFKNAGGTPEMNDPCGYAEKITSEVLKNIPDA
ncbi:DUF3558 domain-containing protein [Saccharopolyspora shandongensis]|uniref:DUF3558 domain-containing protein n=1 Tax=Saccharopolyspora shandongensis TaxID=418495 RepID=UPI003442EC38